MGPLFWLVIIIIVDIAVVTAYFISTSRRTTRTIRMVQAKTQSAIKQMVERTQQTIARMDRRTQAILDHMEGNAL